MTDYISRADAIEAFKEEDLFQYCNPNDVAQEIINDIPSADAESDDLIVKGAKGIKDGLYNIKDGKLFKYKANGGTVRTYPIVPSADAEKPCKTCGYYNLECPKDCEYGRPSADRPIADKCDDCLYEDSDKSLFPCTYCKRNHFDKYEKDESNNITESANDANETENDVIDSDTTSKERLIHSVFESAKQFTSADIPTEDYSDLPDIPRAYYERIVGNMSHEINMLKQQLEDRPTKPILVKTSMVLNDEDFERLRLQLIAQNKDIILLPAGVKECDRPSGEWQYEKMVMPLSNHTKECYRCSVCHTHWDCETTYCPNCGARMKGGDDE